MSDLVTQVQEQITEIARPLADRLGVIEGAITTREEELTELKQVRTQLRAAIKSIDPSLLPEPEKKEKKKTWTPKADSINAMLEFLQLHAEEVNGNGGFHASGLTALYPKELPIPYSTIHKVLAALHEQDAIRLVKTGTGGAKFFKLVVA